MLFVFGFVLAMFGFALLVFGDGPWIGGKRIPSRAARWTGVIWLSYFPVVFGVRYALAELELLDAVDPTLVYGVLAGLCLIVGLAIITRATRRLPVRRNTATSAFTERPHIGGAPASSPFPERPFSGSAGAAKKRAPRTAQPEKNPFDFS
jgi:uncharacterized membrane protein